MNDKYDVIVVGAGNGGLVAAATTAKNGLKTILFEKHNLPGGCASSFRRGRFEFEPSLHELCSLGTKENPDDIYKILDGIDADIDWQYEYNCFRLIQKGKDGYDVTIKAGGVERFLDSMEEACPGCRESVAKLFEIDKSITAAMAYMDTVDVPSKILQYSDFVRAGGRTAEQIMKDCGIPQKAMNIINAYWGYLGVPTDELNGMHFLSMVCSYIRNGAAMPKMRSHEMSLAICESIRKNGGEIRFNSEVTGLIFDDENKVIGVKVGDKNYYAKEVISNVIPNNIFNMIPQDKITKKELKLANARELGMSMVTIYLGLDCPKEALKIHDYTVFVTGDANPRKQYEMGADGFYIVNCLNEVIPDCSPEGTSMLFVTLPMFEKDFPKNLTEVEYKKFKNDIARKYLEDYEKLTGCDIISHIEEIAIATPVTFARYLNTPKGEIYGYANSGWDNVLTRSVFEPMEYKMKGISYVGGHAVMGDGYSSAYITGNDVGKRIVKKLKEEAING